VMVSVMASWKEGGGRVTLASDDVLITGLVPTSQIPSSSDEDLSNCSSMAYWISDFPLGDATPVIQKPKDTEFQNVSSEKKTED
jgi:hypothetical protein